MEPSSKVKFAPGSISTPGIWGLYSIFLIVIPGPSRMNIGQAKVLAGAVVISAIENRYQYLLGFQILICSRRSYPSKPIDSLFRCVKDPSKQPYFF